MQYLRYGAVCALVFSASGVLGSTLDQSGPNYLSYSFEYYDGDAWTSLFVADVDMEAATTSDPDRPSPLGATLTFDWHWEMGGSVGLVTEDGAYSSDPSYGASYSAGFGTGVDQTYVTVDPQFSLPHLTSLSIDIGDDGVATGASVSGSYSDGYNASFSGDETSVSQGSDVMGGSLYWIFGDMPLYDDTAFSVWDTYDTRIVSTVSLTTPATGTRGVSSVPGDIPAVPLPAPLVLLLTGLFGLGVMTRSSKKAA